MKTFCFTIEDNIRFLKEIMERDLESIFLHPYMAMLRRLHEQFDLKIQLNLFNRTEGFDLSQMSDRYAHEWAAASDWLKLSFHCDREIDNPYVNSGYDEVFEDCRTVNEQILRFATADAMSKTTSIHYCRATDEGMRALSDNGILGLLGIFGTDEQPRDSYSMPESYACRVRKGEIVTRNGIAFAAFDMVVNAVKKEDIQPLLSKRLDQDSIRLLIHEQYFYEDFRKYQPDYEEKLATAFTVLCDAGYKSCFFDDMI